MVGRLDKGSMVEAGLARQAREAEAVLSAELESAVARGRRKLNAQLQAELDKSLLVRSSSNLLSFLRGTGWLVSQEHKKAFLGQVAAVLRMSPGAMAKAAAKAKRTAEGSRLPSPPRDAALRSPSPPRRRPRTPPRRQRPVGDRST